MGKGWGMEEMLPVPVERRSCLRVEDTPWLWEKCKGECLGIASRMYCEASSSGLGGWVGLGRVSSVDRGRGEGWATGIASV